MQIGVFQWHIVLVDEDEGVVSMIFRQAFGEETERFGVFFLARLCVKRDPLRKISRLRTGISILQHITVPLKLLADLIDQTSIGSLIIVLFRRFQRKEDDRILLLMFEDFFTALRNFQSVEEVAVVDFLAFFGALVLKEAADHKLIERLAEASWAGKQSYLCIAFNQALYHQGFIDKISVFLDYFLKILHADGDFF